MKQGWEIKRLGDVCTSDLGKTLNQFKDTGDMHPYLCAINILWDKIDFTTVKQTRFESSEIDRYSVRKDDLLICEGGDIGRAAIWDKDETMLYQNALHRVRFYGSIIPRFCLLYLRFLKNTGVLDGRYGKGVTIKHLVKSSLLSIPIPVPPLAEQEKIVAELDCLSGIIEKKKQQLKELDNLAQSIFYEMFGDPVENDKGWERLLFEKCIEKVRYTAKIATCNYATTGTFPIISQEEDYISGYWNNAEDVFMISKPVVIFGDHTRVLKYVDFDFVLGADGVKILQPIDTINAKFFLYYLIASKIPSLGYSRHYKLLKELKVLLPPLSLQEDFASKIEGIEKQKELIAQSIKETETLFNSRMDYYFN